jgi:hypothetical protein
MDSAQTRSSYLTGTKLPRAGAKKDELSTDLEQSDTNRDGEVLS